MVSSGLPMSCATSSLVMPGWTWLKMSSERGGAALSANRPPAHPAMTRAAASAAIDARMEISFRIDHVRMKGCLGLAAAGLALALACEAKEPDLGEAAEAVVAGTNALRREHG